MRAVVVTLDSTIETAGAMATPPPFAPIFASAVTASVASAETTTSSASEMTTPSPISALVSCVSSTRTNDAPRPKSPSVETPPTKSSLPAPSASPSPSSSPCLWGRAVTVPSTALRATTATSLEVSASVP